MRSKKQLNAISYSYLKKQKDKQLKYLLENDLYNEFKKSKYKTMTWFLHSKKITIY